MFGRLIGVITACVLFTHPAYASEEKPVIQLADYLDWETAGSGVISPDGKHVIYARRQVDEMTDSFSSDLILMKSDGSSPVNFGKAWSLTWLDNDTVAYFKKGENGSEYVRRDIPSLDPQSWGKETVITVTGARLSSPKWSPDRKLLAFTSSVDMQTEPWEIDMPKMPEGAKWKSDPTIIDGLQYRVGVDRYRTKATHLFLVSAEGGEAKQLTHGNNNVGAIYSGIPFGRNIEWDIDSQSVIIEISPSDKDTIQAWQTSHLYRVDIQSGDKTKLTRMEGSWRLPKISPDGSRIAYVGYEYSDDAFPVRQIRLMNSDGSNDRLLYNDTPDRVTRMQWHPNGKELLVSFNEEGATKLVALNLKGGRKDVVEGEFRFTLGNLGGNKAIGTYVSLTRSREIAVVDLVSKDLSIITDQNPVLKRRKLGEIDVFWSRSTDGTPIQNWLVKPVDYDPEKSYPLILDIHGGPDLMYGYQMDFRYHEFAARGYLVIYSNPRGSTGYGSEFANAIEGGFPGNVEILDLSGSVKHVQKNYKINKDRIYVMGCSGGGSLAAWMTAKTDIFAASTVMCPVTNWVSFLGTTDVTTWGYTRFKKPFWEDMTKWQEHSVMNHVGNITAPTLVAIGGLDARTPVTQSAELYTALKLRNIPTKMLIFPNAGHGPWRFVPSDLMRLQLYIDDWFTTHTK